MPAPDENHLNFTHVLNLQYRRLQAACSAAPVIFICLF